MLVTSPSNKKLFWRHRFYSLNQWLKNFISILPSPRCVTAKGSIINSTIFTSEDGPNEQKSNDDKILDTAMNLCKKNVEEKKGSHVPASDDSANLIPTVLSLQARCVTLCAKSSCSPPIATCAWRRWPTTSPSASCPTSWSGPAWARSPEPANYSINWLTLLCFVCHVFFIFQLNSKFTSIDERIFYISAPLYITKRFQVCVKHFWSSSLLKVISLMSLQWRPRTQKSPRMSLNLKSLDIL